MRQLAGFSSFLPTTPTLIFANIATGSSYYSSNKTLSANSVIKFCLCFRIQIPCRSSGSASATGTFLHTQPHSSEPFCVIISQFLNPTFYRQSLHRKSDLQLTSRNARKVEGRLAPDLFDYPRGRVLSILFQYVSIVRMWVGLRFVRELHFGRVYGM